MFDPVSICDEPVYDRIYHEHAEKLRNHLYYKCGDLSLAEDLTHETFLRLWKKCAEVVMETVTGFLYTVSHRLFVDKKRSEKTILKFEKAQLSPVEREDPHFIFRTEEFRNAIEKTISELSEPQREAFLMNRIDKLTYKEIASKLNISERAVEKRIAKALSHLKNKIEELKKHKI